MNKFWRYILVLGLLFFVYHFVRDILQILGYHHLLLDIGSRMRYWCGPYCEYITFPPEIFGIIALSIILKRNRFGLLGIILLLTLPFWIALTFAI